uniref:Uncharacterized protein n=1 Tax=Ananas comosus var. bracteatus TaxID=296719 RepID=A0A6V7QP32_ANACO|nr:unnamed protein product [Ananas comosus var. bracteatus]
MLLHKLPLQSRTSLELLSLIVSLYIYSSSSTMPSKAEEKPQNDRSDSRSPPSSNGGARFPPLHHETPIHHRQLGAGILSTFLYRALLVAVFVVALPLLPSRAPEFVDGTLLTRTWELLHLLLVGIAISYGLFSRRNADADADADKDRAAAGKHDAAQSYVPQILRGPSAVFGDDDDGVDGDDDRGDAGFGRGARNTTPTIPWSWSRRIRDRRGAAAAAAAAATSRCFCPCGA